MNRTLTERWLLLAEVAPDKLTEKNERSWKRSRRYPSPINRLYPAVIWFLNWFGPLLTMFSFSRASRLSDARFEKFIVIMKKHSNANLRGLGILAFFPLMEVLEDEVDCDGTFTHPLEHKIK